MVGAPVVRARDARRWVRSTPGFPGVGPPEAPLRFHTWPLATGYIPGSWGNDVEEPLIRANHLN
jgi:hypothetical protein